MTVLYYSATAQ